MEDKQTSKIKRYLEEVIDGRDDLLQNTEKLITSASFQVQALLNTQVSLSQKEALLKYLTKIIVLYTDLNHSVLKFLESEPLPNVSENIQIDREPQTQTQSPVIQDLKDYLKEDSNESISMFHFSRSGPKVSNSRIVNDSYIQKPLDNTTLKAICSNLINSNNHATNCDSISDENEPVIDNVSPPNCNTIINTVENSTNAIPLIEQQAENTQNPHVSPTFSSFSESEIISTVSSVAYQHPLTKFKPPTEIPKQYDTQDLDQIKENLLYLSRKMGFDSEKFSQMTVQFNKNLPELNYEYEEPVRDSQTGKEGTLREEVLITNEHPTELSHDTSNSNNEETTSLESTITNESENNVALNLNNNSEVPKNATEVQNKLSIDNGPTSSTGAIRKQKLATEDLIEFSTSDSENCEKVSTWLNNNRLSEQNLDSAESSAKHKMKQNSAVEKLHSVKRYDRNEEVREQARKDMPDLKLIPVEVPKFIKNDLSSHNNPSEKKNDGKKKEVKHLNKENGVYEINKMELPQIGAVGVFSHIVSPDEFYLQILNDATTAYIDEISDKLMTKFEKTQTPFRSKREAFEKLGKFCFGYILDDKESWYRLQIIDWKLGCPSPDVEVKSVDYGFKCRTSYQYLREMSKDLSHIHMLAIQCHFPLLYPPGSTYTKRLTEWPEITVESLCDMVNLNNENSYSDVRMFSIQLAELEGESLAVDLAPYGERTADSLRNLLLDSGLAVDIIEDYGDNPELGEFFEDIDELEEAENLNELVLGYDAKDEMRICRFSRNDGTCYKGKNCKLEHITLKDGYTTDKTMVFYAPINDPIFPILGETVQVLVTAYIDSATYLVQFIRNPVKKEDTTVIMDRDISDLIDAMNHPKKICKYESFKVCPAIGEIILARSAQLKVWMRVAVRELKYNTDGNFISLEVFAVDFGDIFTVKLKDTRVMVEDFMYVPFQAIRVYLADYQHKVGSDPKKAKRFFDKHIFYKNFIAQIRCAQSPIKVYLTTYKGRDIGPTLVREGFVEKRTMDVQIAEDRKIDLE